MGLIVSVDFELATRTARLKITYTAMGYPAMDIIQEDIRERLLQEPTSAGRHRGGLGSGLVAQAA